MAFLMASQDDNYSGNHQTRGEPPHAPRTLGDRGAKLLADAQRMAKTNFKQMPGRLLPEGGDNRDINIKLLQTQLDEMAHILVDDRLMKPPQMDGKTF